MNKVNGTMRSSKEQCLFYIFVNTYITKRVILVRFQTTLSGNKPCYYLPTTTCELLPANYYLVPIYSKQDCDLHLYSNLKYSFAYAQLDLPASYLNEKILLDVQSTLKQVPQFTNHVLLHRYMCYYTATCVTTPLQVLLHRYMCYYTATCVTTPLHVYTLMHTYQHVLPTITTLYMLQCSYL